MADPSKTPRKGGRPRKGPQEPIVEKRELVDTGDSSLRIEKELSENLLGTIKIYRNQVTTDWVSEGLIDNRAIDTNAVKKLVSKFYVGLDRMNPRHHMMVTISKEDASKLLQTLQLNAEELAQRHIKQDYPVLTEDIFDHYRGDLRGRMLVLQAGQHRFTALSEVVPEPKDQWWPARVYFADLSLDALDRLRENVNDVHTGLNDGERLLHIFKYEQRKQEVHRDAALDEPTKRKIVSDLEEAQRLKFSEYDAGSYGRAYQVWDRLNLRTAVVAALRIPGLRACLSFASMGDVLSWRMMGVRGTDCWLTFSSWRNYFWTSRQDGSQYSRKTWIRYRRVIS